MVQAPVSLLLDPKLDVAAKLLWLAVRAQSKPITIAGLAVGTDMTRVTVRKQRAQLKAAGWYSDQAGATVPAQDQRSVHIPPDLIPASRIRPQAKLLYGLLQTLNTFKQGAGTFTTLSLSQACRITEVTARASIRELTEHGWLETEQPNRRAPIRFTLRNPVHEQRQSEVAHATMRLEEASFRGEAIMREYLSLLIDSAEYEENARPGILINPLTSEPMELDRFYYSLSLAFEYNGEQHTRTTKRFPNPRKLAMQQARDLMKESLCNRQGIRLVVLAQADLSLSTIRERIGRLAPLRDLSRHGELIQALEKVSRNYRR